jgi:hypothetical protein
MTQDLFCIQLDILLSITRTHDEYFPFILDRGSALPGVNVGLLICWRSAGEGHEITGRTRRPFPLEELNEISLEVMPD